MDKEDVIHLYNGIFLNPKKEWNHAICSNMDGPGDDPTKSSRSHTERRVLYGITYRCNLKHDTNELINQTETDSQT